MSPWRRNVVLIAVAFCGVFLPLDGHPARLHVAVATDSASEVALAQGGLSSASTVAPEDERVAVSRADFREKLRGQRFRRWADFKDALGREAELEPEMGGEERLMGGLSIAFVIILNVLVWAVVAFVIKTWGEESPVLACWVVFVFLVVYALCVNLYCLHAYQYPSQRLVTNFLFGAVPLAVSAASYILALLVLHFARLVIGEAGEPTGDGAPKKFLDRIDPWGESLLGRLIFFLAPIPGLACSLYLGSTVSTGFAANNAHFDVLSLCLFIDVGRCAGHASYLFAREWSIGKSPTSISSRPGLCYVFHFLCLAWYIALARLEAGHASIVVADRTKICTLVSLTSYVFFPLTLYLTVTNLDEFIDQLETHRPNLRTCLLIMFVTLLAVFMMAVAVVFDTIEPNLMGIGAMLWVVFFSAWKISDGSLLKFIVSLIPLSLMAFGAVLASSWQAEVVRKLILGTLAP